MVKGHSLHLMEDKYVGEIQGMIKNMVKEHSHCLVLKSTKGKWRNGKFNGKGTFTFSNGNKGVGEFRDNKPWNITTYDKDGNYKWKYVKGIRQ